MILLENRVAVEVEAVEKATASGIVLATKETEKPTTGTVVYLGHAGKDYQFISPLCIGDEVLFGKYAGFDVEYKGKNLRIMPISEVIAIL